MVDSIVSAFNGLMLIVLSLPLIWIAVSPKFKTGIVLTAGVGAMGLAAAICGVWELNGIDPWEMRHIARAQAIGLGGLALCVLKLLSAGLGNPPGTTPRRRKTDWADLPEEQEVRNARSWQ